MALAIVSLSFSAQATHNVFYTDSRVYAQGDPVFLTFANLGTRSIELPNSAPLRILNAFGQLIFAFAALEVITPVAGGSFITWSWPGRDQDDNLVAPGHYWAVLRLSARRLYLTRFQIVLPDQLPEGTTEFTLTVLAWNQDRFKMDCTNAQLIDPCPIMSRSVPISVSPPPVLCMEGTCDTANSKTVCDTDTENGQCTFVFRFPLGTQLKVTLSTQNFTRDLLVRGRLRTVKLFARWSTGARRLVTTALLGSRNALVATLAAATLRAEFQADPGSLLALAHLVATSSSRARPQPAGLSARLAAGARAPSRSGSDSIEVMVYTLSGRMIAHRVGLTNGLHRLPLEKAIARGVYLYVITHRNPHGDILRREVRKQLIVRR
jgi:hypothetical protein